MPQSVTNFTNAMKENYGPGLRNAVNNNNVIWAEATKNEEDIIGTEAVWSVHTGRSASTGNRAELGVLPTADRQRYIKPRRALVSTYHTIKVSGQAKHLTRNDTGAFARALEAEIKGAEKDMVNDQHRQTYGQVKTVNSLVQTGVMATVTVDPGTTTVVDISGEDDSVIRHFFSGMKISFIVPATGAVRTEPTGGYEIASVQRVAKTITVTTAFDATIAVGDFIVRFGNLNNEIDGLRFLLGSGLTYAGVNPATYPEWEAVQTGATTTGISEVLLDEAGESVETDGDGNRPSLFVCEHVQRRKLASLLQAQKRYEGRQTKLTSGWTGLALAEGTLIADRYCPTGMMFGMDMKEICRFVGLDFQWDEDSGEVFYKALDNSDAVEARFKGYHQLAATNRNSHVRVLVSEPTF